jgi:hypothetical protein
MSENWRKARDHHERATILKCDATGFRAIGQSLGELIARMEADWLAGGHAREEAIFIDINASNGHLMVTWDIKGGGGVYSNPDWPTYYLEPRRLWLESEDHADGAEHFDKQAHFAICTFLENMLITAEQVVQPAPYEVYELFEGSTNGAKRVVI